MLNPNSQPAFLSGSGVSITEINYSGFVACQDTVITHIGYGHGVENAAGTALVFPANANIADISVKAGTKVPIKFSSITINGTIMPYNN